MSREGKKLGSKYRLLKKKILFKTVALFIVALIFTVLLYKYVLYGKLADRIIYLLQYTLKLEYMEALKFYYYYIRNYFEVFIVGAAMCIYLGMLVLYLKSFTKYFYEIDDAISSLENEDKVRVCLCSELEPIEKTINQTKETLEIREKRAREAEQKKNDLIVYLAHDLKTPLTSVIGYLTLLNDEKQLPSELRDKYTSIALNKAERLEELINEFFDITRLNLTTISLEYSTTNLTRMLEQIIYEFAPVFKDKNIVCNLEAEKDIMLGCDVNKMQRVFDNLLRNAVNYSFHDSTITVKVYRQARESKSTEDLERQGITIVFVNQGETIPPDKLDKIFEQFYRADSSRNSESGGAGLGLAITKQIVKLHGGEILVSSQDNKVEFTINL